MPDYPRDPVTGERLDCPPFGATGCQTDADCEQGWRCRTGTCVPPRSDEESDPPFRPDRARLAGKSRTFIDLHNYQVLPPAYFRGGRGGGQQLTPYKQARAHGPTWVDYSKRAPLNKDRFRFVTNNFWSDWRRGEEDTGNLVYLSEQGVPSAVEIVSIQRVTGPTQDDIVDNFSTFYEMDVETAERVRITVQPSDFVNLYGVPRNNLVFPADTQANWLEFIGSTTPDERSAAFFAPLFKETGGPNNGRGFEDHAFKINVPFSGKELERLGTINRPSVENHAAEYNFFVESYENSIRNSRNVVEMIPNLYVFLAEKNSKSGLYDRHITLGGRIEKVFMDVLNDQGEKIGEKDEGQYFEKWGQTWATSLGISNTPDLRQISKKFKNIIFSPKEMNLFKAYNEKRFLFPMYVDIEFTTDTMTEVAEAIKAAGLNTSVVRGWLELEAERDPKPTWLQREASFMVDTETVLQFTTSRQEPQLNIKSEIVPGTSPVFDFLEWWKRYSGMEAEESDEGNDIYTLSDYVTIQTGEEELFQGDGENEFIRLINSLILSGRLTELIKNNTRTFKEILDGKLAHSETLFYKISKHTVNDEGTPRTAAIQQIFIPNSNEVDILRFIDTQVVPEEKIYYKISAFELVFGTEYVYRDHQNVQSYPPSLSVEVLTKPSLQLIEIPYFEFEARISDKPPMIPEVNVIPYKGVDDRILINFTANAGEIKIQPILLSPAEETRVAALRRAQGAESGEPIIFRGDDEIDYYEIYRMNKKPESWFECGMNYHASADSESYGTRPLRSSATSFIDFLSPNSKYYYTFRAVDIHGHVSNPSPIYEVEIINADGAIYHSIRTVEFDRAPPSPKSRVFTKYLNIAPAIEHAEIVITNQDEIDSATAAQVVLGTTEDNLFVPEGGIAKKYKFRIISKQSGKKVDLNVKFRHQHISSTDV